MCQTLHFSQTRAMSVKKSCILKYVKRKTKASLKNSFYLVSKAWKQYADYELILWNEKSRKWINI